MESVESSNIRTIDEQKIVFIRNIYFKGKRSIDWNQVEIYLRQYVGSIYRVAETEEDIIIGTDLPGEYTGSIYTKKLKGAAAKAKANAIQVLPEMLKIATNREFEKNRKEKHNRDAKNGWYRYETGFAVPIYNMEGELIRYNIYQAKILVRHASDGRKYLYDILEIKKK
mgnify:FL=1